MENKKEVVNKTSASAREETEPMFEEKEKASDSTEQDFVSAELNKSDTEISEEPKESCANSEPSMETNESAVAADEPTAESAEKSEDPIPNSDDECLEESPIIVTNASVKRKKYLKPWSELSKNERINRVLAVVMSVFLIAIITFTTVWCCIIAEKAYNTPHWVTEREVYRNNVEKTLKDIGSGLKVAEEKFGQNQRWFVVAKNRYDMRYRLFPTDDNVAGYRLMFLDTYRETSDSTVVTWNINGYVENFDGKTNSQPVLTEDDGAVVGLSFWNFEAREKMFSTSGENGTVYANYIMSAVIDGRLYTVSGQCQSTDGTFGEGISDWVRLYGKNVMSHLSDINQ